MSIEFINSESVKSKQLAKNVIKGIECHKITFEVFQRYIDILSSYYPMIKGKDYDALASQFKNQQESIRSCDSSNHKEVLENFNEFAQEQCKVLFETLFDKPYQSDL